MMEIDREVIDRLTLSLERCLSPRGILFSWEERETGLWNCDIKSQIPFGWICLFSRFMIKFELLLKYFSRDEIYSRFFDLQIVGFSRFFQPRYTEF